MDWSSLSGIRQARNILRQKIIEATESGQSISEIQNATTKELPVQESLWLSKFTIPPPPEDDIRNLLFAVIDAVNDSKGVYDHPMVRPTEAEWMGFRRCVSQGDSKPSISEKSKYSEMMRDAAAPMVVYYLYGGAFYMNIPSSYRRTFSKIVQMTGGRVFCVRQRLCPQNPFPAALLDAFLGYVSLLAPPPGSHHEAISPCQIVLAGDSSGACLALGLLQVLLTIRRQKWASSIAFHGHTIDLALPACLTGISTAGDITYALPSFQTNARYDIFPQEVPTIQPGFRICELWPSDPPRGCIYCNLEMMYHPIVSPTAAADWSDAPPLWLHGGQEQIIDAVKFIAQRAHVQGVKVDFKEYEGMPHCFPMFFPQAPQSEKLWNDWTDFCKDRTMGKDMKSCAAFVEAQDLEERRINFATLTLLSLKDVRRLMKEATSRMWVFTGQRREPSRL